MLQQAELNAILQIFENRSISLFLTGSQVDGEATVGSDVDVVVLDPLCHEVLFKSIESQERKLDLTIFPVEKLGSLSNPKAKLDTLPISLTESAVLNAILHGKQILPINESFPYSERNFERASWAMVAGELRTYPKIIMLSKICAQAM